MVVKKRGGSLFRPAATKTLRQVQRTRTTVDSPANKPAAKRAKNLAKDSASEMHVGMATQTKFVCKPGKDGSRLLTLDNYVVSFTNSVGTADDALMGVEEAARRIAAQGGFQTARSMVVKAIKTGPVEVEPVKQEQLEEETLEKPARIMLDAMQERIAKLDINKPLLIVAGAGSGKTATLCARVLEMINQGVDPARILVITFTNKAADELKERIARYMAVPDGTTHSMPHASTFHSWCYKLIAENYKSLGWTKCPLVAAVTTEHETVLAIALEQLEDCRRLVQSEQMLGIMANATGSPPSIYIQDVQQRWEAVITLAKQVTGFNVDSAMRAVEEAQEQKQKRGGGGRKTKLGDKTAATTERFGVTRAVYAHLYAAIGRARGMVDFEQNPLDLESAFPSKKVDKEIMGFIYRAKSRGDTPSMYPLLQHSVLEAYNSTLERFGLVDFDDLLSRATELLQMPEVLKCVQAQHPFLLVDEFQDLNQLQMKLVMQLQGSAGRVTAVGDERQSIYAFRGASCEHNFKTFLDHFVDAQVERKTQGVSAEAEAAAEARGSMECLTRNYRSHQSIVDLGNIVARDTIGSNALLGRLRVPLTARPEAPIAPVSVWESSSVGREADVIVRRIRGLLDRNECRASDIAVISRCLDFGKYRPTDRIEIELLRSGIAYVVRGSQSALKLKRMQTFMALIRVVSNTDDDIAFGTCLDELVLDVGPVAKSRIMAMNALEIAPGSLFHRAECIVRTKQLPKNARAGVVAFIADVRRWQAQMGSHTLLQILESMYADYICEKEEDSGGAVVPAIRQAARSDGDENDENEDRLWNMVLAIIDSLKSPDSATDFDSPCSPELLSLFSAQLCMLSTSSEDPGKVVKGKKPGDASKEDKAEKPSAVVITTVHQAKGLEWEHVFVPHFIENMFPMGFRGAPIADTTKALMDPVMQAELQIAEAQHFREEGRLAYVAFTRAKRGLYISVLRDYPMNWMAQFFKGPCTQSRYLPDIMCAGSQQTKKKRDDY